MAIDKSKLLIAWEAGDPTDLTAGIAMLGSPAAAISDSVGPWDTVWPADRIRNGTEIPDPTSWGAYTVAFVAKIISRDGRTMFTTNGLDAIDIEYSATSPIATYAAYETYVGGVLVAEGPESDPPSDTDYQSVVFSKTGADSAELFINGVSVGTASGGAASTAWSLFMDTGVVQWASLWIANETWGEFEAQQHYNEGNFLAYDRIGKTETQKFDYHQSPGTVLDLRPETGTRDRSGYENHATYEGGVGVIGNSYVFDGTDDYIETPDPHTEVDEFSVEVWLKPDGLAVGVSEYVLTHGDIPTGGYGLRWRDGEFFFTVNGTIQTGVAGADGVWQHIALVRRSGVDYLYLNGVETNVGTLAPNGTYGQVQIGANLAANFFSGEVAGVRFLSRALSATEVALLHQSPLTSGKGADMSTSLAAGLEMRVIGAKGLVDQSGTGRTITASGGAVATPEGFVFDGDLDWLECGPADVGTPITAACWIDRDDANNFVMGGQFDNNEGWRIHLTGGNFRVRIDNTNYDIAATITKWTHLAFTYSGTTLKMYVNGLLVKTQATTEPISYSGSVNFRVGSTYGVANEYEGVVDDACIFSRVLSDDEVSELFGGINPSWEPFGLLGGESVCLQPSRYSGTGDLLDETGNGADVTLVDGASITDGVLTFDGSTGYAASSNAAVDSSDTNYSASVWVKTTDQTGDIFALGRSTFPWSSSKWIIRVGSGNLFLSTSATLSTGQPIADGEWHHVAFTMDTTETKVYVDGELTNTFTGNYTRTLSGSMALGARGYLGPTDFLDCQIDDPRIFGHATLSDSEVKTLFDNGTPGYERPRTRRQYPGCVLDYRPVTGVRDRSYHLNHGTYEGGAFSNGQEFSFDGVDDSITFPEVQLTGDFTAEGWIFPTVDVTRMFVGSKVTANHYLYFTTAAQMQIRAGAVVANVSHATNVELDQWQHIAFVRESGVCSYYLNGVVGTTTGSNTDTLILDSLGRYAANAHWFSGGMESVRIHTKALTPGQLANLASDPDFEPFGNLGGENCSLQFGRYLTGFVIADQSGSGNSPTKVNACTIDWKEATAEFNGASGRLDWGTDSALIPEADDWGVSFWIKPRDLARLQGLFAQYVWMNMNGRLFTGLNASGHPYLFLGNISSYSSVTLTATNPLVADQWHHLAFTREGDTFKIFIDGVEDVSHTDADALRPHLQTGNLFGALAGGTGIYTSSLTHYYDGFMADFRSSLGALRAEEVKFLFDEGTPGVETPNSRSAVAAYSPSYDVAGNGSTTLLDYSGEANHGTLTNMDPATDWVGDTDEGGLVALDFDGVDDAVRSSEIAMAGSQSLVVHFQWQDDATFGCVAGTNGDSATDASFAIRTYQGDVQLAAWEGSNAATITHAITQGQWVCAIATYDETTDQIQLFIDGVLVGSDTLAGPLNTPAVLFSIGSLGADHFSGMFEGAVDDVASYPRVLSQSEIIVLSQSRNIFNAEAAELVNILNFRLPRSSDNIVGCL